MTVVVAMMHRKEACSGKEKGGVGKRVVSWRMKCNTGPKGKSSGIFIRHGQARRNSTKVPNSGAWGRSSSVPQLELFPDV